jgi:Chaperone of endosialidase
MGIFDSLFGPSTTTKTETPSPLAQAGGLDAFNFAKSLASSPFNAPLQGVAGFNPTQGTAFGRISDLAGAPNSNNPFYNQEANAFSAYGSAPASKIFAPSVLGGGTNAATASLSDYINPNLSITLNPALQEIARQALIAKNGPGGVGSAATTAGAFGDARQGVENANVDEAAMRQAAQATGQAYQNAFNTAAALRGADISNIMGAQTTNANLNEQALNRILGSGNALQNLASYTTGTGLNLDQALLASGNQQQQNAQQQANAIYNQQLQNLLGPYQYQLPALTAGANVLNATQPKTTTTSQPNNALWNILGTLGGSLFSGLGQGAGLSAGQSLFTSAPAASGYFPGMSGATTAGAGAMDAAAVYSDERLKLDMHQVGATHDGLPLYVYRYVPEIDPSGTPRIGLSAQDVEKIYPEAVSEAGGFKAVDYGKATRFARVLGTRALTEVG